MISEQNGCRRRAYMLCCLKNSERSFWIHIRAVIPEQLYQPVDCVFDDDPLQIDDDASNLLSCVASGVKLRHHQKQFPRDVLCAHIIAKSIMHKTSTLLLVQFFVASLFVQ